ncbi:sigma-54 interaction domain-containing protein [Halobacillus salinus]|uniref:PAS domain-containing protein n=1 Tax=Halobacillus salinus TaxID=192814 RepID=A0A4Z0GZ53_9BACI|nr:sigma 54-interacting transcriptional regulator [Halobacillus salinus]TGB02474.1 PAS domain-containing protein [Halobacillus salinus]
MNNQVILIAGTEKTRQALHNQLNELLGEYIEILSYAVDEHLPPRLEEGLIIYSSKLIELEASHIVTGERKTITAERTMNYEKIDRLFDLPKGTEVLCVNDTVQMAEETIDTLIKSGMDHLSYRSYYPGARISEAVSTAITPGEVAIVPSFVSEVVDIGVRLIDISTLFEILDHFQLKGRLGGIISKKYTSRIIELSQKLAEVNRQTASLNRHLKQIVDGVNEGVMAVDASGKVTVFNPFMETYTGMSTSFVVGKTLGEVFSDPQLVRFLQSSSEEAKLFSVHSYSLMVYRFQWDRTDDVLIIFKDTDETISMEKAARRKLRETGYIAKHHFRDIVGESFQIEEAKRLASKLAKAELPLLIEGENGTGKELFASAVHNHSKRKHEPFLAVNCSALPEDLLESELFGYEEGSFTGAKKGGKKGLFEQADGGTLFLDEIGDISLKLQARLLRVVQEMEVRKIGGTKNINVDVRIIAATNKPIRELIQSGDFREDLYHRLSVLFLHIPPLRERMDDLEVLIHHFLKETDQTTRKMSPKLMEQLKTHSWTGNVRELRNVVSYLITVSEEDWLTPEDLAGQPLFKKKEPSTLPEEEKQRVILTLIYDLHREVNRASRKLISERSQHSDYPMTEQQTRKVIKELEGQGLVQVKRGKTGTELTKSGMHYIERNGRP